MTNKSDSNISQSATAQAQDYTRLHISPLDPQLLKVIVPGAILSKARDISYHTIQTFPDKPFGFVELPTADAEKIKNKLNGAVLRGNKIRIEPARPHDMPKPSDDGVADGATGAVIERKDKKSKASKKDKKRKRDPQEIVGVELEEGRKVKRGWTLTPEEAKAKKRKEKEREKKEKKSSKDKKEKTKKKKDPESEYTEGPECLVKTRIPPNKRDTVHIDSGDNGDGGDGSERKKKSRKQKHEVVVHEFEKNSKFPTFFKASNTTTASGAPPEFVEGKGWVDEKGQVVEEETKSTRPLAFPKLQVEKKKKKPAVVIEDDTTSSSGSSEEEDNDDDDDDDEQAEVVAGSEKHSVTASESDPKPPTTSVSTGSDIQSESASPRPKSSSSATNLTIRIPPATPSSTKVHPLEALYKKQKQEEAMAESKTADAEPFNFFGNDDIEDEDIGVDGTGNEDGEESVHDGPSQATQMPMTPFSKQDFESRGLRSAAPTPDTAHPSRFSRLWPLRGERDGPSDVEEEDDIDDIASKGDGSGAEAGDAPTNPNTDFEKWFWEHRGDLNRSWKKRRKMAAKEKRYRDNRARADKAI